MDIHFKKRIAYWGHSDGQLSSQLVPINTEETPRNFVMANSENLKEPWKSGDPSPNPSGRPVGSRSMSTILKELLDEDIEVNGVKLPFKDAIVRKLIKKANAGNLRAIQEIFDRTEGKSKQEIKLEGIPDPTFHVKIAKPEDE